MSLAAALQSSALSAARSGRQRWCAPKARADSAHERRVAPSWAREAAASPIVGASGGGLRNLSSAAPCERPYLPAPTVGPARSSHQGRQLTPSVARLRISPGRAASGAECSRSSAPKHVEVWPTPPNRRRALVSARTGPRIMAHGRSWRAPGRPTGAVCLSVQEWSLTSQPLLFAALHCPI